MDPEEEPFWEEIRPDLTPLIDCIFLLLIFFMVTMVFARPIRLKVELAEARNSAAVQRPRNIKLIVTPAGALELEGEVVEQQDLEEILRGYVLGEEEVKLTLLVDRRTEHSHTLRTMEAAQRAGLSRIFLATRSKASLREEGGGP